MLSMDEVYKKHSMMVYKYLLSLTGDEDLSEELTQETFYQAVKSIESYDESCKITTWLCAIAKNQLGKYSRKHRQQLQRDEAELGAESVSEDSYLLRENRVDMMKMMRVLPDNVREVMYLRIFGNLSFSEIGEVMEKSENWARVTFYRGKVKLREAVEEDGK